MMGVNDIGIIKIHYFQETTLQESRINSWS